MMNSANKSLKKVLAILPAFIPSTTIDVVTPLIELHRAGIIEARINLEIFTSNKDVEWCDLAVLCRNTEPTASNWYLPLLELGKPYIYDIDDNLFELKNESSLGQYHNEPSRQKMLTDFIRLASVVRVYSKPMYDRVKELNPNITQVIAPVDLRLISYPARKTKSNVVKIVYATSRSDDYLADIFKSALKQIIQNYKDRIQIYFLGYNPPEFKEFSNVIQKPLDFNYNRYLKKFSRAGYDIGLAPLLDDVFHRSKTNNKFREYGACHIAGIYSDVEVYSSCVLNNETGLLVGNDPVSWYNAIAHLIENFEHRLEIQENAYEFVRENYSQASFIELWQEQIIRTQRTQRDKKNKEIYQLSLIQTETRSFRQNLSIWLSTRIEKNQRELREFGIWYVLSKFINYFNTLWILYLIRITLFRNKSKSSK